MKITDIEIKNFRAFPKTYHINLHNAGKNLLVYGENGSGKSSLYLALKYFLESGVDQTTRTIKTLVLKNTGISLLRILVISNSRFRSERPQKQETYEWSESVKETNMNLIIEASKARDFLTIKTFWGCTISNPKANT